MITWRRRSDAYRKEIDQEENVWRSLPFFAATLALQLAALGQMLDRLVLFAGWYWWAAVGFLLLAALGTGLAIAFIWQSVRAARFQYVSPEPILHYAKQVRAAVEAGETDGQVASAMALRTIKAELAQQYAAATQNNRLINQGRALWRTRAAQPTLVAVLAMLAPVVVIVTSNVQSHEQSHIPNRHAETRSGLPGPPAP